MAQKDVVSDNNDNYGTTSTALISLQSRPDIGGLIDFARAYSPYYGSLYANVLTNALYLQDYPVVDLDSFWRANASKKSQVITMPHSGGIVWKTGGEKTATEMSYISALLINYLSMCRNSRQSENNVHFPR